MPVAQQLTINRAAAVVPLSFQQVTTGLNSPQNLPSIPAGAAFALIQAIGGDLRINYASVTPTGTLGMVIIGNDTVQYNGPLDTVQFIADAVTPATQVLITYFRYGT